MFQQFVEAACRQDVYADSPPAYHVSVIQTCHRNLFATQWGVNTDSKLTPQISMHRQSKKEQSASAAPRHCYRDRKNRFSGGPHFFRNARDNLRKHVLPTPLASQCQAVVQDDGSRILIESVTQHGNVRQPAICGAAFRSYF